MNSTIIVPVYEVGAYDVAISTSSALETLTGHNLEDTDIRNDNLDLEKVDEIWINVRTLVRNTLGSMAENNAAVTKVLPLLKSDIRNIVTTLAETGKVIKFYLTDMRYVKRVVPKGTFKTKLTLKQQVYRLLEEKVLKTLMDETPEIELITHLPPNRDIGVVMVTHHPLDALCHSKFNYFRLVETHTGNVRTKDELVKKILTPKNKEYAMYLPFNMIVLTHIGDGNKMLSSGTRSEVTELLELAKKKRWTKATTKDKIISDMLGMG